MLSSEAFILLRATKMFSMLKFMSKGCDNALYEVSRNVKPSKCFKNSILKVPMRVLKQIHYNAKRLKKRRHTVFISVIQPIHIHEYITLTCNVLKRYRGQLQNTTRLK